LLVAYAESTGDSPAALKRAHALERWSASNPPERERVGVNPQPVRQLTGNQSRLVEPSAP